MGKFIKKNKQMKIYLSSKNKIKINKKKNN